MGPTSDAANAVERPAFSRRRVLLAIAIALVLAWIAGYVYLIVAQDRLIFPVRPLAASQAADVLEAYRQARSLEIRARDGTSLHAWYRPASGTAGPRKALVYFGASSEQVHWQLAPRSAFDGWDLLLIDYRGYGLSGGHPGQAALQDDAALWLDQVAQGTGGVAHADKIVVMGTSMGSYFATHLAATRKVDGVVLVVPADSVLGLVQSMLPIYPVAWFLKHPFDSMSDAPRVQAPTLFFVAMQDKLVSVERARRLYDHWGSGRRVWVGLPNANHYTASADPAYWQRLGEFLAGL